MNKYCVLPLMAILLLTSCATIMHGTHQTIGISSNPTAANVWVDQYYIGKTPLFVAMTRRDNHLVRIDLEGFHPYEVAFTRKLSGWVFGNIVFGGLIGLVIDAVSGGIFALTPDQIHAEMLSTNANYCKKTPDSYIAIVMKADPSWKKIGNLEHLCQSPF